MISHAGRAVPWGGAGAGLGGAGIGRRGLAATGRMNEMRDVARAGAGAGRRLRRPDDHGVRPLVEGSALRSTASHGQDGVVTRRISPRSGVVAGTVAGLLWLVTVGSVQAALFLILDPLSGPPGSHVSGRTGGEGAFSSQVDPLTSYLVASASAGLVTSPDDTRLIEIGQLVVDPAGNGRLTFVVPRIDPGGYVVVVHCPSCAPFSSGSVMAVVADFQVTRSPPNTDTAPEAPALRGPDPAVLGAVLFATALAVLALYRRLARQSHSGRGEIGWPHVGRLSDSSLAHQLTEAGRLSLASPRAGAPVSRV